MCLRSRTEEGFGFSFRMSLCQVDLHFVSAQLLESSSWWSNPLHSARTVGFFWKERDEGFSLDELLEEEKDLGDQREHG